MGNSNNKQEEEIKPTGYIKRWDNIDYDVTLKKYIAKIPQEILKKVTIFARLKWLCLLNKKFIFPLLKLNSCNFTIY